jgi:hypothetical protein
MALLLLPLHAAAAYGGTGSPSDPVAGSPGAAVYQLPLEKGRADAAPQGDGGLAFPGGGSGGPEDESFYRSENNFGSSSQVPGAGAETSSSGGSPSTGAGAGGGADGAGNGGGTAQGNGSGSGGGSGASSSASRLASRSLDPPADTGNTSLAANVALLGAILLLATGVGVAAARMSRSRHE